MSFNAALDIVRCSVQEGMRDQFKPDANINTEKSGVVG
jgi:hypothetical protein